MPTPYPTLEKIHFLMFPDDETDVLRLRAQTKPMLCNLPLRSVHRWSQNKNSIRYCLKCGKVDFNFGITGMLRSLKENEKCLKDFVKTATT